MTSFDEFFRRAHGLAPDDDPEFQPYHYQRGLAEAGLPELLVVPTGAGKTAAAVLPHLYRRLEHKDAAVRAATPRRLVVVLPQRTLVEQTVDVVTGWLDNLGLARDKGLGPHVLMGGASTTDRRWKIEPGRDGVFIGTQDMVLSRLLMRGYGEGSGSWPISFGVLHADSQFVFDEIQLMGPGLPTSLQLDALRDTLGQVGRSSSMWMSATVHPERLATVDRPHPPDPVILDPRDLTGGLARRLNATRAVHELVISDDGDRFQAIAEAAVAAHRPGTRSIVALNTVARARKTYDAIVASDHAARVVLVHSRFRPGDRQDHLDAARAEPGMQGTIVVTTQVLEAGIDLTSRLLITEAAPWSSVTQRAGRCNRGGEHDHGEAGLWWLPVPTERGGHLPYAEEDIVAAADALRSFEGRQVTSRDLQDAPVSEGEPLHPVLRRVDLLDLFDTNPDLNGNSVDVGRWVRDADDRTVSVAWRPIAVVDGQPQPTPSDRAPGRDELCPAPIGDATKIVEKGRAVVFDDPTSSWRAAAKSDCRPGTLLVIDSATGGYTFEHGWSPGSTAVVEQVVADGPATSGMANDRGSHRASRWVPLAEHLSDAAREAQGLIESMEGVPGLAQDLLDAVVEAARWHDLGKAHKTFIDRLNRTGPPPDPDEVYAKSINASASARLVFRHELASALMLLEHEDLLEGSAHPFLVTYLVAAHHGKVRMSIRSSRSDATRGTVLGVADGDTTQATSIPGGELPPVTLHLDVIALGAGGEGGSWQHRTIRLRDELGPFRLAYLEALVRMADWRASAAYDLPEEVEP